MAPASGSSRPRQTRPCSASAGRSRAQEILARAATLLPPDAAIEPKIRVGQPAAEIIREAHESNQELIILGERLHPAPAKRILAPTVERVLEQSPCPSLIARGVIRPPKQVLLCEAGRDPSLLKRLLAQLRPMLAIAEAVTVLHVMSQMAAGPGVSGWELEAGAEELIEERTPEGRILEEDLQQLAELQVQLQPKVRHGLVVREILSEAHSGDYDLVVIGANRGAGWQRFLLDDLAQEIIDQADRPVLVI